MYFHFISNSAVTSPLWHSVLKHWEVIAWKCIFKCILLYFLNQRKWITNSIILYFKIWKIFNSPSSFYLFSMRTLCSVGEGDPLTVIISAIIKIMTTTIIIRIQNASSDSILAMIKIMAITINYYHSDSACVLCVLCILWLQRDLWGSNWDGYQYTALIISYKARFHNWCWNPNKTLERYHCTTSSIPSYDLNRNVLFLLSKK